MIAATASSAALAICTLLSTYHAGTTGAQDPPAAAEEAGPGQATESGQESDPEQVGADEEGARRVELTLQQAVEIALGNDLGLQIEELVTDIARFDASGSWGAFDPIATATGSVFDGEFQASSSFSGAAVIEENSYSAGAGVLFPLTTGGSFGVTFDLTNTETNNSLAQGIDISTTDVFALEFRQPLLQGFGKTYATSFQRESDLEYQRQLEQYRLSRQDLIASVATAYWDLVAALGRQGVAETTLQLGAEQLDQNTRRLQAGVGTQVEVLQAEANVATREEELLLRQTEVKAAADRLKAILYPGTDKGSWDSVIAPSTPLPEPPDSALGLIPPWGSAWLVAQDSRSELRQQRLVIQRNEVALARSSNERRPTLDLLLSSRSRGFSGESQDAFETAIKWDFPQNTAALDFSIPIGNRTARYAEESARAALRASRLVYDQLESEIVSEVRTAIRQVTYSVKAVVAADKSLDLAKRQLEAEQARYREGLSTNFEVLVFQEALANSLYSSTLARSNLAKSLVNLQQSQGVLGELGQ